MDEVVGWSPDGRNLLFVSDRTGAPGIWTVPVQNGKPQGTPQLVKSDVGPFYPLGLTRSGALYYGVKVGGPDIYVVPFDFSAGKLLAPASAVTTQFMGSNRTPDWSPDGKYLAYVTQDQKSRKANSAIVAPSHPRSRPAYSSSAVRATALHTMWPRTSPTGVCTTRESLGGTANWRTRVEAMAI
jgi:Tol biopolymer transport system component